MDLIEQELLDKPRDVVIVHMYLAPDETPAEVLPLFEERLQNSGINYQLNTTGVEQEDWQNGLFFVILSGVFCTLTLIIVQYPAVSCKRLRTKR